MSRIRAALLDLLTDLRECVQPIALIGGLAVSARTEPRFTPDIDLAVDAASDADAEQLVSVLTEKGYRVVAILAHEETRTLMTARLTPPAEDAKGVAIDLLFASSGIERAVTVAAEPIELFADVFVPVARVGHLIALKLLARDDQLRQQDWSDLRLLFEVANKLEIARAREAVRLIAERGYARRRNLTEALEEWTAA